MCARSLASTCQYEFLIRVNFYESWLLEIPRSHLSSAETITLSVSLLHIYLLSAAAAKFLSALVKIETSVAG